MGAAARSHVLLICLAFLTLLITIACSCEFPAARFGVGLKGKERNIKTSYWNRTTSLAHAVGGAGNAFPGHKRSCIIPTTFLAAGKTTQSPKELISGARDRLHLALTVILSPLFMVPSLCCVRDPRPVCTDVGAADVFHAASPARRLAARAHGCSTRTSGFLFIASCFNNSSRLTV